jgi:hypothetical protein
MREIIGLCGSFLTIREDTVYFVHQSAQDFIFAETFNKVFPRGVKDVYQVIFSKSLAIISRTLYRDIYSLKALGFPAEHVITPDPDPLAVSRYPYIYWINHLYKSEPRFGAKSSSSQQIKEEVDKFLRETYLY